MTHFRYALRTLRKNAGFSLTVVAVLGLGIGGTVAIFSIVNAALLKPLPYDQPERLVELWGNIQRGRVERRGASWLDYRDWKQQSRSFEGLASFWDATLTLTTAEERVLVRSEVVGAEYFRLLGLKPVIGRDFRPEEETDSALPPAVVLSHNFWEQRFGSDSAVLGKKLILESTSYTVVGVMPRGFRGLGDDAEIWVPHASLPARLQSFTDRSTRGMLVLGRLRSGITLAQAQAEMDTISRALEAAYRDTNDKRSVEVSSLVAETFGAIRPALLVLLGAVSIVLAIAFANVANLMLLRTERRHSEMAIRTAIGASRWDLLKVTLAETSILSFAGSALGLLVSIWGVDLILAISPAQLPSFVQVGLDRNVIMFAIGVALLVALLMAIAPALQFAPANLHDMLSSSSTRTTGARSSKHFRNALIVGEVALSFVLLLSAGLLIESFRRLLHSDTGFEPSHLLTLRLGFESNMQTRALTAKEAVERVPGVKSAALSAVIPFTAGPAFFYSAEGQEAESATTRPRAYAHFIGPGFFRTMAIPLRNGRDFDTTDREQSVIVSEKVIQRFWPGQDPIGKRIKIGGANSGNAWMNIVGVVGDTRTRGIPDNPTPDPDIYMTFERFGGNPGLLIRTELDPASMAPAVLNELKRVDKQAVIAEV